MKNTSIKTVVAIGIGAALFFVLGRFVAIPSGVPNTNISLQYAVLGLLAAMYGPLAGGLIGFIGHTLIDLSWGGSPWWSWVIAIANVAANVVAWLGIAPVLDILIYAEPASKVFAQGALAAVANSLTAVIVGAVLAAAYAKTIAKKGSLDKE